MSVQRYTSIAVGLHWLIAILIIGMLAVGKFMTSLDESDALRFSLTQWHKSFGIAILSFSVLRILWRITHPPPALPASTKPWERLAAGFTHFALYVLIIGLPATGWILVSASPLNISTVLFQTIPLPHLPGLQDLSNKAEVANLFHQIHEIASGVLIVLLLLHIGAALKHHFFLHDDIMTRMAPDFQDRDFTDGLRLFTGTLVAAALSMLLFKAAINTERTLSLAGLSNGSSNSDSNDTTRAASATAVNSQVTFTLVLMGADLKGIFPQSNVDITLDRNNIARSSLRASVGTEGANTGDPQVDSGLSNSDWFDVVNFPEARFVSTSMSKIDASIFDIAGDLTIRDTTLPVQFELTIDEANIASGGFTINRLDYALGAAEQPDDSAAGFNVLIEFTFQITP